MGKGGRTLGLAFLLAAFCFSAMPVWASEGEASVLEEQDKQVGQVYANMPEVVVYGTGFSAEEVEKGEGYLSQERLKLMDVRTFSESGEGICYYVLLDISGSIPNAYFRNIKEGIQNLQDRLNENDRLVLCTFGEEVALAADGSQTSQDMAALLETIRNRDQKTLLFEGIDRVVGLAEQSRDDGRRKVLAVISDGEDIAVGKKMAQEAQSTLREQGIPAYAFCIQNTAAANINTFGEFARVSGGRIVTFGPEEAGQILCDLADQLKEDIRIEYRADSNIVSNKEEAFSLNLEDGSKFSRAVMNNHWIPDTEAPTLLEAESNGDRQIRLLFDETLLGAETGANYHLTLDGEQVAVTGVSCSSDEKMEVKLFLAEPVQNGTYVLECANITDNSMEKNPLGSSLTVSITNASEIPETEPQKEPPSEESGDYTGVLFLIFAAVVALIIILVVKSRKKNSSDSGADHQESEEGGSSTVALEENQSFHQHVKAAPIPRKRLEVWISKSGMKVQRTFWDLGTSLIVGRSSSCDVHIEDLEMSRQHFCLEAENGAIYISDLNSTNGTSVNGIRIHEKRRLEPGSVIEAGSMKITIRW